MIHHKATHHNRLAEHHRRRVLLKRDLQSAPSQGASHDLGIDLTMGRMKTAHPTANASEGQFLAANKGHKATSKFRLNKLYTQPKLDRH
jgi:hypothetical protein